MTLYCPSLDGLGPLAQLGPLLQPSAYAQQWGEIGSSLPLVAAPLEPLRPTPADAAAYRRRLAARTLCRLPRRCERRLFTPAEP